jgi:hypothetical protein
MPSLQMLEREMKREKNLEARAKVRQPDTARARTAIGDLSRCWHGPL